ncbi:MAG TPA: hypothetical protein VFP01_10625 [Propionibacteriaceae bacterium]|nr:hypothetical protein [Propionibacteriaceae bacterium]
MSKVTHLASGALNRSGDTLSVELHQPAAHPAVILLRWPVAPSVAEPNPKALAAVAASMVRILAEAQARLAKIRAEQL